MVVLTPVNAAHKAAILGWTTPRGWARHRLRLRRARVPEASARPARGLREDRHAGRHLPTHPVLRHVVARRAARSGAAA